MREENTIMNESIVYSKFPKKKQLRNKIEIEKKLKLNNFIAVGV